MTDETRRNLLRSIGAAGTAGLGGIGSVSGAPGSDSFRTTGKIDRDPELDRTVTIEATDAARYRFQVTGLLSPVGAPSEAVDRGEASASIHNDVHEFEFTGEFTAFSIKGDATVRVDGEPFDATTFPHNTLTIEADGSVSYELSASGGVVPRADDAEQPNQRTVKAETDQEHVVSYAGEITYFDLEGEATIRRNGNVVDADEVLPSTNPHTFVATARETSKPYQIEVTQDVVLQDSEPNSKAIVENNAVLASGKVDVRHAGRVAAVEHPNGARIELSEIGEKITCYAPDDRQAKFQIDAEDGVIIHDTAFDEAEFTLDAGDDGTLSYYGDVTRIVIDGLEVRLSPNAYPDAKESMRLQEAARIERTDAYRRLASTVRSRIRHDAAGIQAAKVENTANPSVQPTSTVVYGFADLEHGDHGTLTIKRTNDTGDIEQAVVRYEQLRNGKLQRIDTSRLSTDEPPARATLEREQNTVPEPLRTERSSDQNQPKQPNESYDAAFFASATADERGVKTADELDYDYVEAANISDIRDILGDVREFVSDISTSAWDVASAIVSAAKDAVWDLTDIKITATSLVIKHPLAFQDLLSEMYGIKSWKNIVWKFRVGPIGALVDLAAIGFFKDISGGKDCWACVGIIVVMRDMVVCDIGVSIACSSLAPALPLAIACSVFVGAACSYGLSQLVDAEAICSDTTISSVSPCS